MVTQTTSNSRIIAVWLMLIVFLCGMMMPSLVLANKEITIGTEGDPRDGLDYSGGGSGSVGEGGSQNSAGVLDPKVIFSKVDSLPLLHANMVLIIPVWENGQLHLFVVFDQSQNFYWRTIR